MKKFFFCTLLVFFTVISVCHVYAFPKEAVAVRGTPAIDGFPEEIWDSIKSIDVSTLVINYSDSESPTTAEVKTLWDQNCLYILADVKDICITDEGETPWDQDSVDIYLDQANRKDGEQLEYTEAAGQFRVGAVESVLTGMGKAYLQAGKGFIAKSVLNQDGYILEAAIPWTVLRGKIRPGVRIGFEVQINDNFGRGFREAAICWNSESGEAWRYTDVMGELVLQDIDQEKLGTMPVTGSIRNPETMDREHLWVYVQLILSAAVSMISYLSFKR